jgi:single-stranded-DNA-specific exonuclease
MPHHPLPKKIIRRALADSTHLSHLPPLLRRVYLARELQDPEHLERSLSKLPSPWLLSGMDTMVAELMEAIRAGQRIVIVADFDADGATSCVVAMLGLKAMGARNVGYLVPNRFEYGYGLTPEIVAVAAESRPDVLVTVDNGIASIEGVRAARERGIKVLVTDHHLPGEELPAAAAIVNPNLAGDGFPSKALAGVGVMFYVLMALRSRLRDSGWFAEHDLPEPNLGQLLDLVALGTVADVVPLDHINRILVHQGLQRIRSGQARPGIVALLEIANRTPKSVSATDLGFAVGPRLNAAGRLEDMSLGIECLLAEDVATARTLATQLDGLNRDRREIEDQMKLDAHAILEQLASRPGGDDRAGWCLFQDDWHQGVIGILASRMKDRLHRPVIAFAPAVNGDIKGSARSIPGVHIRDVLSDIAAAHPELLTKFGGHAMAAGLSLKREDFQRFARLFDQEVAKRLQGMDLDHVLHSDGELDYQDIRMDNAEMLQQAGPWGQSFPEPLFDGEFEVLQCRIVGERHLKWLLQTVKGKRMVDAISFFVDDPAAWLGCRHLKMAYRLDVNEYRDNRSLQLRIEYMEGQ